VSGPSNNKMQLTAPARWSAAADLGADASDASVTQASGTVVRELFLT
jgi:hypothetical protein